jgi:D-serine deaminase-like pyridoxal phosphate-dependent protein
LSPASELLDAIETPVAVVDAPTVRANARRVAEYCARHGLAWRPHVKTHKSLGIARIQLEAGARGLTVATPREAEVMAEVTDDVLLAYPPIGRERLQRLMHLPERLSLTVALDSREALRGLAAASREAAREVGVLVEVDLGMGRVGVQTPEELTALAGEVAADGSLDYRGILFYPGHIRARASEQVRSVEEAAVRLDTFLAALDRSGLSPATVSGGSTPTLWTSHHFGGITEIRSGTCIYNDRDMLELGVCDPADCAYTILATVVSTSVRGQAVIDAGSKALAKESLRTVGDGFGWLPDHPDLVVSALSEEHGIIPLKEGGWNPRVGDRVRVVPNHVCVSVNLQDRLVVLDGDTAECWPIEARGRL